MSPTIHEFAEYLEYRICNNRYDDDEYGLYIDYKKLGYEVFKDENKRNIINKLRKQLVKDSEY